MSPFLSLVKSLGFWVLFLALLFLVGSFLSPMFPAEAERYVYGVFGSLSALLVTWLFLRREGKTFSDYGLVWEKGTFLRFVKGFLLGTLIFLVILLVLCQGGALHLEKTSTAWNPMAIAGYLAIIPMALMEEITFRGYPFLNLNKVLGLRLTQAVAALAFGLYHIATGWNIQIAFLGPGVWALVFGLAAIWSKGIALPTGIHVALNWIQQLVGMKGEEEGAIWALKPAENASPEALAQAEQMGLII